MRLQKYIAMCGAASRRGAEELIKQNRVKVNDILISEMGHIIDESTDVVKVDNKVISPQEQKHYYAFNKPVRIISSSSDEKGRKNVLDYFNKIDDRLFMVGRLDFESCGLILVTNDGEFANRVTHPKYECTKTYLVRTSGKISEEKLNMLRQGIVIEGYKTSPAEINVQSSGSDSQLISFKIREGRNRQVRKMVEAAGAQVKHLERTAVGIVQLGALNPGEYRKLSHSEVQYFFSLKTKQKK
ncbi:MAG: rRNA pseudouridine synthase [Clostridia bacterium]|nr:rRNA pseudouridine synthase [Clostridia bacterium]